MTPVELLLARKLRDEATPAPAEYGRVSGKQIEDHARDFADSLGKGEIGEDGKIVLWGVYVAGTDAPICHTGNGPTSKQNAMFIEFCFNNMAAIFEALRSPVALSPHDPDR